MPQRRERAVCVSAQAAWNEARVERQSHVPRKHTRLAVTPHRRQVGEVEQHTNVRVDKIQHEKVQEKQKYKNRTKSSKKCTKLKTEQVTQNQSRKLCLQKRPHELREWTRAQHAAFCTGAATSVRPTMSVHRGMNASRAVPALTQSRHRTKTCCSAP